jgi:hypothetical protein
MRLCKSVHDHIYAIAVGAVVGTAVGQVFGGDPEQTAAALPEDPTWQETGLHALSVLLSAGWPGVFLALGILGTAAYGLWLRFGRDSAAQRQRDVLGNVANPLSAAERDELRRFLAAQRDPARLQDRDG